MANNLIGISLMSIPLWIFLIWYLREEKWTREIALLAQSFGFSFTVNENWDSLSQYLSSFEFFFEGWSPRCYPIKNLMQGKKKKNNVMVFDFKYGPYDWTCRQTVIYLSPEAADLPVCQLTTKNLSQRITRKFVTQDINFDSYPIFSKRFLLQGPDEKKIRKAFGPEMIQFFEDNKLSCMESNGKALIFYRPEKRIKPGEILDYIIKADKITKLLGGEFGG